MQVGGQSGERRGNVGGKSGESRGKVGGKSGKTKPICKQIKVNFVYHISSLLIVSLLCSSTIFCDYVK